MPLDSLPYPDIATIAEPAGDPRAARIIYDAMTLLARNGWVKGCIVSPQGYCVAGALLRAIPRPRRDWLSAHRRARQLVTDQVRGWHGYDPSIEAWNDMPGRTQDEVMRVLQSAHAAAAPNRPPWSPLRRDIRR